jgi:hypothetical protein
MLRQKITEELFAEASEQMTRYVNRIDYLVGANNELMEELRALEKRQLVDETSTNEGFENF